MADGSAEGTCDEPYNQRISYGRVDFVREEYKRYKRKKPPPDFSEVIDFQDPPTFGGHVKKFEPDKSKCHSKYGLRCVTEWQAYALKSCPGFMFIVNPFLPGAQHYWTRRCMEDFPRKPNVCNLDAHVTLDPSKSVWELSHSSDENSDLMDRLRWVHLGYHFDYNVVDYKSERYYDFPSDLASMTQHIAHAIGYPEYSPEAGIVNYYPLGGSMGGHTDHYESDLSWPLISLSFGQTAIFLIGGETRDIRPVGEKPTLAPPPPFEYTLTRTPARYPCVLAGVDKLGLLYSCYLGCHAKHCGMLRDTPALYVRSGDIIIMSGKSRTAFHAVPRIVKVGKEDEPPSCLKWKDGFFVNDVTMASEVNPDDSSVPDENVEIPDAQQENNIGHITSVYSAERSEKPLFQEPCDNKVMSEFGNDSEDTEIAEGCQCNKINFCGKSMKTLTSEEWRQFEIYLSKTRINVNVRQVHEKGKTMNTFRL